MPSRRPWLVFLASWALFSALAVMWSLATPISAAPDEPAHMVKAASVVRGQLIGPEGADGSIVQVPQYIAWTHAQTCFAMNSAVTADCIPAVPGDPAALVDSSTTAGRYNPVYYVLVGWPTLVFGDSTGTFAMRIVSGVLVSAFLGLATMMIAGWRRRAIPLIALGTAVTPMVLFLNGSVNPNALEITATLAAFVAALSVVRYPDPALLAQRSVILVVSAGLAANMRGISPLWVAAALLIPFLLASRAQIVELWRSRIVKVAIGAIAVLVAFAVVWLRLSNSVAGAQELDAPGGPEYIGASPLVGFFGMLAQTGDYLVEMIGKFGWLDTPVPVEVVLFWMILIGSLVAWSLVTVRGAALRFAAALLGAFLLLPAIAQGAFITSGGWIWQGRYTLPLLAIMVVGAGALLSDVAERLEARTVRLVLGTVAIGWAAGQTYAFAAALHRYAIGASESWLDFIVSPAWSPALGIVPSLLLFAVGAAALALLGFRMAARDTPKALAAGL